MIARWGVNGASLRDSELVSVTSLCKGGGGGWGVFTLSVDVRIGDDGDVGRDGIGGTEWVDGCW